MFALFTAISLAQPVETPVRATLADGQVLMGQVRTRILRLQTGAGLVDVPLSDVGEVRPSENRQLGKDDQQVNVWLRNGSELRGTWSDPELAMGITVGGGKVGVNLPMHELTRFQLRGEVAWPDQPSYRVQTTWGDDFLVDPARTRLQLENQLGSFSPSLAECVSAAPVGDADGEWRIELTTGTVLVGELKGDAITVAPSMGPKELTLPLAALESLSLRVWSHPVPVAPVVPRQPHELQAPTHSAPPVENRKVSGTREYEDVVAGPAYGREEMLAEAARQAPRAKKSGLGTAARNKAGRGKPQAGVAAVWFDKEPVDTAKDQAEPQK